MLETNTVNAFNSYLKASESKNSSNPVVPVMAMPIDSEVQITVKDSKLEALICVYPPKDNGRDITISQITKAVKDESLTYGVDYELLENIVNEKMYDTIFTFAHGDPPVNGENETITSRFDLAKKLQPKLLENGKVDYRDLGSVINIRKGDIICDIKIATLGANGMDVYGNQIVCMPGKEIALPQGENTGLNGDGTKLMSLGDGNLVYEHGKYTVQTTYMVKENVDISTGNIDFIGDVMVRGSIDEGFSVTAGKGIIVNGMINSAILKANDDIVVRNGVINSVITAVNGSVTMGFGENSKITCKGDVKSSSLVSCYVEAEGNLTTVANPGTIVGGLYKIMGNIVCNVLGHRNYIATTVMVGNFATLNEEREHLVADLVALDTELKKINLTLDFLQEQRKQKKLSNSKEEMANAAVRLKVQKSLEKKPINKRIAEIDAITTQSETVTIRVNRYLHPNVKINFGNVTYVVAAEQGKCTVRLENGEILIT